MYAFRPPMKLSLRWYEECCMGQEQVSRAGTTDYTLKIPWDVITQITSLTILYPTVYSVADQRKHQSSASLSFVQGIHRWPVNSPYKGPVTRKMFPFDDVIMYCSTEVVRISDLSPMTLSLCMCQLPLMKPMIQSGMDFWLIFSPFLGWVKLYIDRLNDRVSIIIK